MHQSPRKQVGPQREKYAAVGWTEESELPPRRAKAAEPKAMLRRKSPREEFSFDVKRDRRR